MRDECLTDGTLPEPAHESALPGELSDRVAEQTLAAGSARVRLTYRDDPNKPPGVTFTGLVDFGAERAALTKKVTEESAERWIADRDVLYMENVLEPGSWLSSPLDESDLTYTEELFGALLFLEAASTVEEHEAVDLTDGTSCSRYRLVLSDAGEWDNGVLEAITQRQVLSGKRATQHVVDLWVDESQRVRELTIANETQERGRHAIHTLELRDFGIATDIAPPDPARVSALTMGKFVRLFGQMVRRIVRGS